MKLWRVALGISLIGRVTSNHYEWDNYHQHWGHQEDKPAQMNEDPGTFQGYPANHQPTPIQSITWPPPTFPPDEGKGPPHRQILKTLYRQIFGNSTIPGLQAGFSGSHQSQRLNSQDQEFVQSDSVGMKQSQHAEGIQIQPSESQHIYELPQYIEPPPLPDGNGDYYSYS